MRSLRRSTTELVLQGWVGAGGGQCSDDLVVALCVGIHQWRGSEGVLGIDFGGRREQTLDHSLVAAEYREGQWPSPELVGRRRIGAPTQGFLPWGVSVSSRANKGPSRSSAGGIFVAGRAPRGEFARCAVQVPEIRRVAEGDGSQRGSVSPVPGSSELRLGLAAERSRASGTAASPWSRRASRSNTQVREAGRVDRRFESKPERASDQAVYGKPPCSKDAFEVTVPGNTGVRYARVSGDYNPHHLWWFTARPLGYRLPIAHGMWTFARVLSDVLEGIDRDAPLSASTVFKRPFSCRAEFRSRRPPWQNGPTAFDLPRVKRRQARPICLATRRSSPSPGQVALRGGDATA